MIKLQTISLYDYIKLISEKSNISYKKFKSIYTVQIININIKLSTYFWTVDKEYFKFK